MFVITRSLFDPAMTVRHAASALRQRADAAPHLVCIPPDVMLSSPPVSLRLPVLVLALLACGRHPSAPSEATPIQRAEWIPARYASVAWFPIEMAPLLDLVKSLHGAPPCVMQVTADLDGYLQATGLVPEQNGLMVFVGRLDRTKLEACLRATARVVVGDLSIRSEGAITELSTVDGKREYLGWAGDGAVVWHRDRALVQEALDRKSSFTSNERVAALMQRVPTASPAWNVAALDITSPFLGVPSQGFVVVGDLVKRSATTTLVFATPEEAARGIRALGKLAEDARFSPQLREAIGHLQPTQKGTDLSLNVLALFEREELLAELTRILQDVLAHQLQNESARGQ
jgi:hypothetical protein